MTVKTLFVAAILTLAPALASAACSEGHRATTAAACAEGQTWDAQAGACVDSTS